MSNSDKIILDLCGGTGSWSKPYRDAGYDVRVYQTDEETTKNDPLRQKMNDFMNCLAREIVQNSPQYHCTLWDE